VYLLDGSDWGGAAEMKVRVLMGDKRRDGSTVNVLDIVGELYMNGEDE
jgi:hypothetical protein